MPAGGHFTPKFPSESKRTRQSTRGDSIRGGTALRTDDRRLGLHIMMDQHHQRHASSSRPEEVEEEAQEDED